MDRLCRRVMEIIQQRGKLHNPVTNTGGMLYRERNVKALLDAGMSDADAYALLAENGMMVKRPLVVGDDFVLVGFKEVEWERALL